MHAADGSTTTHTIQAMIPQPKSLIFLSIPFEQKYRLWARQVLRLKSKRTLTVDEPTAIRPIQAGNKHNLGRDTSAKEIGFTIYYCYLFHFN